MEGPRGKSGGREERRWRGEEGKDKEEFEGGSREQRKEVKVVRAQNTMQVQAL